MLEAAGHATNTQPQPRPAGLTNRQVAAELVVSPKTVGAHIEHIYLKAGVSTRAGAALFAMERQLLQPPRERGLHTSWDR